MAGGEGIEENKRSSNFKDSKEQAQKRYNLDMVGINLFESIRLMMLNTMADHMVC